MVGNMEIFSVGEKIKRARIYKGYTLKDICGDKVSVSKMSCIENDKIPAEGWIIDYIASKLDLDIEYLKCDVKTQITNNVGQIENNKENAEYESKLNYNLAFALKYEYYDQAFYIMHLLFLHNIENNRLERLQALIPGYYEISIKSSLEENQLKYYMDIGKYLYKSKEYVQAVNYYNMVKKGAEQKGKNYISAKATLNECKCYIMLENYEKAYKLSQKLLDIVNYFQRDIEKADTYSIIATLSIINMDMDKFEKYKYIAYEFYGQETYKKARVTYNFAIAMMNVNLKYKGTEYIKKALEYYPKDDLNKFAVFIMTCLDNLINNDNIEKFESIINDAIDYSIKTNNMKCIEKAYHYKSILSERKQNTQEQETYMNLSLDVLMKFGKKKDLYERYIDIGNMYYNMNNIEESIEYFNLAVKLGKKI
ncbi:tetratricopeptide repeat protein [Clostridium tetani]|uniref:helix-turn-helix domain-containing protein n=1 Tax=Clostridium tetani TaxID=1513 RepID=UPI002953B3A0|nr:helix-turn-helix transcriptional regulator [Clostridium tetani]BDR66131.1 tetratricopeptide repeat protein [Clostridium tetani]BDR71646.1 tetratricopeptide repeat protein [Clostridium tetani]